MNLRLIRESDFPEWRAMRIELYGELENEFHDKEMPSILKRDDWHCWFVEDEEQTIGMVELSLRNVVDGCLSSPVPYIEGLFIESKYRNQGLGAQLIQTLFAWSREQGYTELALNTELENTAAQRFYNTLGFEENERTIEFRISLTV